MTLMVYMYLTKRTFFNVIVQETEFKQESFMEGNRLRFNSQIYE